ncbi:exosortase A [Alteromonas lipolytica]|nr:exosortase A [Alteromonas lipolytica]
MNQTVEKDTSNSFTSTWLLLALVSLGIWFWSFSDAIVHMVSVWSASEAYKHCFFVPAISIYLAYEKREQLSFAQINPNLWLFIPLLLLQLAYLVVAELEINLFMHAAAVSSLILLLWALLGNSVSRILAFPLFYLLFAIPFGEELVPYLQQITADLSVFFLNIVDIPVYREGLYLYLPNGTFHVAEACAGVRFLIGTFTIGVLFSYLSYTRYWKRLLFILICAVLPVIANGFRAFGIMVIGYYSDMKYATGADHLVYGWFFFAFILVLLFYIGSIGTDKAETPESAATAPGSHRAGKLYSGFFALVITMLLPGWLGSQLLNFNEDNLSNEPFNRFISTEGVTPVDNATWAAPTEDQTWFGQWHEVTFRVVYVNEQLHNKELVSSRHRVFDNERWTQSSITTRNLGGHQVQVAEVVNIVGNKKILVAWYQVGQFQSTSTLAVKWQQLVNKLSGQSSDGYFIVAEVPDFQVAEQFMTVIAGKG